MNDVDKMKALQLSNDIMYGVLKDVDRLLRDIDQIHAGSYIHDRIKQAIANAHKIQGGSVGHWVKVSIQNGIITAYMPDGQAIPAVYKATLQQEVDQGSRVVLELWCDLVDCCKNDTSRKDA